jgi:hypothetical protein
MLIPRFRASRLSAACVWGVTVSEIWTRATRPMNGRPPFFFAAPVFRAGVFFNLVAIESAISDTKPRILFTVREAGPRR